MSVTLSRSSIADVDIDEFRAFFVEHGWKKAERAYGQANVMPLIAKAGGHAVLAERAKRQPCGRKAGGGRPLSMPGWTP